jgi:hypothetical protein
MEKELFYLYMKEHYMTINDVPLFSNKFIFALTRKELNERKKRVIANAASNAFKLGKLQIKKYKKDLFSTVSFHKHTSISNGVEKKYYQLRGFTKDKFYSNGNAAAILCVEQQFSEEIGEQLIEMW